MTGAEVMNPVTVEAAIRNCSDRISNSVQVCNDRYVVFLEADRHYDRQYALAYLNAGGPQYARKYEAEIATTDAREERDVADAAYRYADRLSRALQDELRAWQSVGASVRAMYAVAGRGEGA